MTVDQGVAGSAPDTSGDLAARLADATLGLFDLATVYLGDHLGFYRALAASVELTAAELGARTGTHPRYVREGCEQQAATGILACANPEAGAEERRYSLPAGHAAVLAERDGPAHAAGGIGGLIAAVGRLPAVLDAFRTGSGVDPGRRSDERADDEPGEANRPLFRHLLAAWLAAIPEVDARLRADPPAHVLDIGCGAGWSSLAIATAYPLVRVDGVDPDERAIALARRHADAAQLEDRVRFAVRDGADPGVDGPYDLVTLFETSTA